MNKKLFFPILVLLVVGMACTITVPLPTLEPGETQTLTIDEPIAGNGSPYTVDIHMNAGGLNIQGGGSGLVEGSIKYNIPAWKPVVTRADHNLTIKQNAEVTLKIPTDKLINQWDLTLGAKTMDLDISANAYKGDLDLSGVPLRELKIKDNAGESHVIFDQPNPELMEVFTYTTAASNVELSGLGYANFSEMKFDASAGAYTLDFSGPIQHPVTVGITGTGCNIKIVIPAGTSSNVETIGTVTAVEIKSGTWTVGKNTYTTQGQTPLLDIKVEINAGRLELVQQ